MNAAIFQANITEMRRFPIGCGVMVTDTIAGEDPIVRLGHVVGYALNSCDEVVIEVRPVNYLFEGKTLNESLFIHPQNKVTRVQPLSEV